MFGENASDSSDSDWLHAIVWYFIFTARNETISDSFYFKSAMDLGLDGGGAQEFFDELSDDDHMPGVEEAEEAKDGKKKKTATVRDNIFSVGNILIL